MSGKSRKLSIDRLSSLPDEVICHILSFLPTKLSVSTCVLAKRWRFLWAHVPVWDFEGDFFRNRTTNTDLIYRVILWHKSKTLHALRLRSIQCNEYQLETLIITAIDRKIRNLYLDFDVPNIIKLCRPLFNCKTVVDMRLGNCKGFASTGDICLPSLKKLHLSEVEYKDDEALSHLLSGCPLLQELILDCYSPYSDGKTLKISSSTIKMLELNLRNFMWVSAYSILIDGPAVRCLRMGNCYLGCITFPIDMTSLVKVDLCFRKCYAWEIENNKIITFKNFLNHNNRTKGRRNLIKSFNCLRQIRCLKISSCEYLKVIDRVVGSIGKFNNLTKLELQVGVEWHLLVKFLEVADNLEVLIADVEIHNSCMEPKQVPKCLQSSLKTITIKQQGFEEHELDLVHYLLRNSQVLERMEILPLKDRPTSTSENGFKAAFKALQRIALFERGSKACQLAFFSDY